MPVDRHRPPRSRSLAGVRLALAGGVVGLTGLASLAGLIAGAGPAAAAGPSAPAGFSVRLFASAPATAPATVKPDDIARLGPDVFVGWQNGVGTSGEPDPVTGQTASRRPPRAPPAGS